MLENVPLTLWSYLRKTILKDFSDPPHTGYIVHSGTIVNPPSEMDITPGEYVYFDVRTITEVDISLSKFTEVLIDRLSTIDERYITRLDIALLTATESRFVAADGDRLIEAFDVLAEAIQRHAVLSVGEIPVEDMILEIRKQHNAFIVGVVSA